MEVRDVCYHVVNVENHIGNYSYPVLLTQLGSKKSHFFKHLKNCFPIYLVVLGLGWHHRGSLAVSAEILSFSMWDLVL